ncbi:transposase, partial [Chryseobacterium sp. SIMBA_029]|uniref:transposase n=1 Tax=Chryseobacterium sp. SIMBA_029 TaxID=3085772 RepID=UPI00397AE8E1
VSGRAYKGGLKPRGSLPHWTTPEAREQCHALHRTIPDGRARYPDLTIATSLMLRTAFRMPLRQAEGLMVSVISVMGLTLDG